MKIETNVEDNLVSTGPISKKHKFEIIEFTGGDGHWQQIIFMIIFLLNVPVGYHTLSMSFLAPNIDHWCARPPQFNNLSAKQWRELAMPKDDQQCSRKPGNSFTFSKKEDNSGVNVLDITKLPQPTNRQGTARTSDFCAKITMTNSDVQQWYEDVSFTYTLDNSTNCCGHVIVPCDSWEYDETVYSSTILSKFNLVCDRKWQVSLSKSVFMAGWIFSLLVFGHLSDWIGRKPVMIISSCITFCSALASAFSTSFTMFLILQFFIAVGTTVTLSTPFVLLMEIASPNKRHVYGFALPLGFTLGYITLPVIAWLFRDAFWIQMAITFPCLIAVAIWWIPESPRWLLNHGKIEEAYKVLIRAAKMNGVKLSMEDKAALKETITTDIETCPASSIKGSVLDLLRKGGLWKITLNVYYNWFVNAFVYFGLSYNTNELAGNPFINFALSGIVEIPAYLLAICTIQTLGKRNLLSGSMVMGGIACFASYLLPSDPPWLSVTVSMVGKFFITISFGLIYIFSNEVFPTVVRNIALGSASVCARLGSLISPFMRELGDATHPIFPQLIYGVLAVSSGLLVFLLPDTRNCTVPDTMEEAVQFSKIKSKKQKIKSHNHLVIKLKEDGSTEDKR